MTEFPSVGAFVAHLMQRAATAGRAQAHALDVATRIIQTEAREELGRYQAAAGPFNAWPELADATKEERANLGFTPNDPLLRTGTLRDNIERSSDEHEGAVGVPSRTVGDGTAQNPIRDIGDVAVWMEQGTQKSPPRSFLCHAAVVKEKAVAEAIGHEAVHAISGMRPTSS